jgi:hypothetical protein
MWGSASRNGFFRDLNISCCGARSGTQRHQGNDRCMWGSASRNGFSEICISVVAMSDLGPKDIKETTAVCGGLHQGMVFPRSAYQLLRCPIWEQQTSRKRPLYVGVCIKEWFFPRSEHQLLRCPIWEPQTSRKRPLYVGVCIKEWFFRDLHISCCGARFGNDPVPPEKFIRPG